MSGVVALCCCAGPYRRPSCIPANLFPFFFFPHGYIFFPCIGEYVVAVAEAFEQYNTQLSFNIGSEYYPYEQG